MALRRVYDAVLADHLRQNRQMALVAGARQVGKTTTCGALASPGAYLNWDDLDHRRILLRGPAAIAAAVGLERLSAARPILVLDELQKNRRWKNLLKGLFDVYGDRAAIVVTGSTRLDLYRRGGDSLMGRYFLYRMHPLSVGELVRTELPQSEIHPPRPISDEDFRALWEHGGYPEPFLRRDLRFSNRWHRHRAQQLVREDVHELTGIQDLGRLEVLVAALEERSSSTLVYSNLAQELQVSVDTVRRWVDVLGFLRHGFLVRPWWRGVTKSLRREPKWFSSDWSRAKDAGARAETLVACHLLKAVELWTDLGFGSFELHYLRDKEKREVDFAVIRDKKPWFLVEVKLSDTRLSPHLRRFQEATGAAHAFQVVWEAEYVQADCFSRHHPTVVPARTLLSQLP